MSDLWMKMFDEVPSKGAGTVGVPAGGPGGGATWTGLQVDTGAVAKRSGTFTITGSFSQTAGTGGTPGAVGTTTLSGKLRVSTLAVGNAAAATVPGSVVQKIQVFDQNGSALGFIPVYSTIT